LSHVSAGQSFFIFFREEMFEGADVIRILAIDQAKTTGYAVFDEGILIDFGTIELGRKNDLYENILHFARQKINELINTSDADMVVIEDIQQQNQNVSTYKKLAMLMGVLLCLFQENNIAYHVVPPTRWKSFCKIKGKKRTEQKENTILFVKEKFNLDDIAEDIADAISLGFYTVNNIGVSQVPSRKVKK